MGENQKSGEEPHYNPEHLAILKSGVAKWNAWRVQNRRLMVNLSRADLRRTNLQGADLRGADLRRADLSWARIAHADLSGVEVTGASLRHVRYAPRFGRLPDPARYRDLNLGESVGRSPLFDRFVRQMQFADACSVEWPGWLFWLWRTTCGYGRSLSRWLAACAAIVVLFAAFSCAMDRAGHAVVRLAATAPHEVGHSADASAAVQPARAQTWVTHLYFSVVTFSTLGFGDVTPCDWRGEVVVMIEVFLGYVFLGGLISIFAMKVLPPR